MNDMIDMRGRTDPSGRLEPGHGPEKLGRCFGPVASSRELSLIPLSAAALAAKIRGEDSALTEPSPARAGSCASVQLDSVTIRLEPVSPSIGTVVHGLDLKQPLDQATVSFLRELWLARKVIYFRNQHLTREEHIRFSGYFGALGTKFGEPLVDGEERKLEVGELTSDSTKAAGSADQWHSDASWAERPPMGSILLCKQPAPVGGDTLWTDAYAMYEGLSPSVKSKLQGASCLHQGYPVHRGPNDVDPSSVHPALRTHPETGRTALYVSPLFTKAVVGLPKEESDAILMQCWLSVNRPEYQSRFRWEVGSIAMWDNRSCLHYACGDWWPHTRKMERICVVDFDEAAKRPFYRPSQAILSAEAAFNKAPTADTWEHIATGAPSKL